MALPLEWVKCSDRLPEHDAICFISDGMGSIALASAERKGWEPGVWWDVCGITGRDWELNFEPTHWALLTLKLP